MFVIDWVSVSIDFTDVTLVRVDTYGDDEDNEDDKIYQVLKLLVKVIKC